MLILLFFEVFWSDYLIENLFDILVLIYYDLFPYNF